MPRTNISDLNSEEILGTFYKKGKVTKRKGDKLYVKQKGYDNSFNSWIDKIDIKNELFYTLG